MLDVIQTTGEPGTRSIFRVYQTYYPFFVTEDNGSEPVCFIIIAAVNYDHTGKLWYWAAYSGCIERSIERSMADQAVARHGDKLSERDVMFFLRDQPELNRLMRRYRE